MVGSGCIALVIHGLGGGRDALPSGFLDGTHLSLSPDAAVVRARKRPCGRHPARGCSPNKIKKVLKEYTPFKRMIYQKRGQKVRDMFDRDNLPRKERQIRNRIKSAGLWER